MNTLVLIEYFLHGILLILGWKHLKAVFFGLKRPKNCCFCLEIVHFHLFWPVFGWIWKVMASIWTAHTKLVDSGPFGLENGVCGPYNLEMLLFLSCFHLFLSGNRHKPPLFDRFIDNFLVFWSCNITFLLLTFLWPHIKRLMTK